MVGLPVSVYLGEVLVQKAFCQMTFVRMGEAVHFAMVDRFQIFSRQIVVGIHPEDLDHPLLNLVVDILGSHVGHVDRNSRGLDISWSLMTV